MKALLVLALAAGFCVRAAAEEPAEAVSDGCATEISLLCARLTGAHLLACLERHSEDATPLCRRSLKSWRQNKESAAAAAVAPAHAAGQGELRLVTVSGSVFVRTAGSPADRFVTAQAGMSLEPGDVVRTGLDGGAEISIDGQSVILLSPGSDFALQSQEPSETRLFLGLGRLLAKIEKMVAGRKLTFATPTAVAAVRGTELGIEELETGESRVAVFDEGVVAVSRADGGPEVTLRANQETAVAGGKAPAPARALEAFKSAKASVPQLRQRLGEVRKQWAARTVVDRQRQRSEFLKQPAVGAAGLPKFTGAQTKRAYPQLSPAKPGAPAAPGGSRPAPAPAPPRVTPPAPQSTQPPARMSPAPGGPEPKKK